MGPSSTGTSIKATCFICDAAGKAYIVGRDLVVTLNKTLDFSAGAGSKPSSSGFDRRHANSSGVSADFSTKAPVATSDPTKNVPVAVIGLAVNYSGAPGKERFWDLLCTSGTGTGPISADRLGVGSTEQHVASKPGDLLGADSLINNQYGSVAGVRSEHDLLLGVARDALADAGSPDVSKRCGIVSGCLSFPRDGFQSVLNDVYRQHTEKELGGTESMVKGQGKLPVHRWRAALALAEAWRGDVLVLGRV